MGLPPSVEGLYVSLQPSTVRTTFAPIRTFTVRVVTKLPRRTLKRLCGSVSGVRHLRVGVIDAALDLARGHYLCDVQRGPSRRKASKYSGPLAW